METSELLKKIRRLEIKTKGLTKHIFSGEYHSAFKGRGMAFSEVRDYTIGDEVRTIDWNVTARYSSPYVKVFEEERELTVMLIIDVSGSSAFGSEDRSKKDVALEVAAVLAFSAIANNDKVGALFISDKVERYITPEKGKQHALVILRELIEFKPTSQATNLTEGLKFFRNTQKKRTISFVISDFIDENNFMDALRLTRKRHDLIAIKITDDAEKELPNAGFMRLFNAETGETSWVNSGSEEVRNHFEAIFNEREKTITTNFKRSGIDCVSLTTHSDFIPPLVQLFKRRS
ncbi:MAG: DUF58 domain-containing protein [Crocinitomicaceae bacterium]|nr:DUF58 domain-containing protein [Crocinitomicaceae bacterium]